MENKQNKRELINHMETNLKRNAKRVAITLLVASTLGLGYTTSKYSQEAHTNQVTITEQQDVIKAHVLAERDLTLSNVETKKANEALKLDKNKLTEDISNKDKKTQELVNKVDELNQSLKIKREKQLAEANKVEKEEAKAVEVKQTSANPEPKTVATEEKAEPKQAEAPKQEVAQASSNQGTNFKATFYAVGDGYTPGTVTANGTDVSSTIYSPEGYRIIAVDTSVIPMNSIVKVTWNGNTFLAKASDTGSAINGNKIDILIDDAGQANANGLVSVHVEIM